MTTPPPTPVPRITPKTLSHPAAAPSVASDSAKQLASLARRTGRPSAASRSRPSGLADQPGRIGVLDEAGARRERPGDTDADSHSGAELGLDPAHQRGHRRDGAGIVAGWGRDPPPRVDRAAAIDGGGLDLGAAEIDADAKPCGHASPSTVALCSLNDRLHQILQIPGSGPHGSLRFFKPRGDRNAALDRGGFPPFRRHRGVKRT